MDGWWSLSDANGGRYWFPLASISFFARRADGRYLLSLRGHEAEDPDHVAPEEGRELGKLLSLLVDRTIDGAYDGPEGDGGTAT